MNIVGNFTIDRDRRSSVGNKEQLASQSGGERARYMDPTALDVLATRRDK
jgi:hypothetical protein